MQVLVTTPVLNAIDTIDATILSVVTQAGAFALHYHIHDGGSTDGTVARLAWWQRRLAAGALPLQPLSLHFGWTGDLGATLGTALCRGFGVPEGGDADFLTWLEPGAVLLPGALALAADLRQHFAAAELGWFGGLAAPADAAGAVPDRVLPTAALAAGLCDGQHWDRLEQPGVFFRRSLWQAIDPQAAIAPLGPAAAWNLWRLLARKTAFVQVPAPLGRAAPAGAADRRTAEAAEIETLLPAASRRAALAAMLQAPPPGHRLLRTPPAGAEAGATGRTIVEETAAAALAGHGARVLGAQVPGASARALAADGPAAPPRVIARAGPGRPAVPPEVPAIVETGGIVAFDGHWQYPAITEQHAFRQMLLLGGLPAGATYVGFPWATLIDKLQRGAADAALHLRAFRNFCRRLPEGGVAVTVCQHIHLRRFLWLIRDAGIGHVFWSHATRADVAAGAEERDGVTLHPFPLYPVQVPLAPSGAPDPARRHLFSFIGARANRHYLTEVRNLILDSLGGHPQGLIEGRETWHYNAVVYDQQIQGKPAAAAAATGAEAAADMFRAALADSVFALCPSGTGPNSIRLWESLGAGAIPVILAETWAPPGNPALWDAATLSCPETAQAVAALPARLAALAADPARLAAMRQAGRQLWMLYGPDAFVTDIGLFLAALPTPPAAAPATAAVAEAAAAMPPAEDVLRAATRALLLGRGVPEAQVARAQAALPPDHPARLQFDRARALAPLPTPLPAAAPPQSALAAPMTAAGAVPALCLCGAHAGRTPLAYAPFRRALGDRLAFVADPGRADLVMTGFNADLPAIIRDLAPLPAARRPRIAVLSEEPLWDSLWSQGFEARDRVLQTGGTGQDAGQNGSQNGGEAWPYVFLNHHNSRVFAFERIPCFLLTRDDFAVRYALWTGRHAGRAPADLCAAWQAAAIPAAFVAERREDPRYDRRFPGTEVLGLSVWRSRLAQAVTLPGTLRLGLGWPPPPDATPDAPPGTAPDARPDGSPPRRQDLPDWHLDKAARLDGRVALLSAVENTHQNAYVSEKPFDAFALGAVPVCHAGPRHRLHELITPEAMLNTWGLTPDEAARRIADWRPDRDTAAAWVATAQALVRRLADAAAVRAERERVLCAILGEVAALV